MNRALPLVVLLLALNATPALPGAGVNLRWNTCLGDGGVSARTFACDANVGSHVLGTSFELAADVHYPPRVEAVLDLASADPVLPAWWQFVNAGACRPTALTIAQQDGANCPNWSYLQASLSRAYQVGTQGPNTARILAAGAQTVAPAIDILGGVEWGLFRLAISNASTQGAGSCGGCFSPVCIVFNSFHLNYDHLTPPSRVVLSGPTNGTDSHYVTWQGGAGISVGDRIGCPAATPVRNATWGSVKALYR